MKKKTGIAIAVAVILLLATGAVIFLLRGKEETYRSILVQELNGTTEVTRKNAVLEAYDGMKLQNGDEVEVQRGSELVLKLDQKKYVYAQELTCFRLEATGTEGTGKLVIHLQDGQTLIDIQKKLSDEESFEVETQNAALTVRGTVFLVNVYRNEAGETVTETSVFDGEVKVESSAGETVSALPGRQVLVIGETEPEVIEREIPLVELPEAVLERLRKIEDVDFSEEEIEATPAPTTEPTVTSTPTPEPAATSTPTPVPIAEVQYDGVTEAGLKYSITGGACRVYGLADEINRGTISELIIPDEIDGYPVTMIDHGAFSYCTSLVKAELPDSITFIGEEAFKHCYLLTEIELPDSLTFLGKKAFWSCFAITEITIPAGVTEIKEWTFSGCEKLTKVELPSGLTVIEGEAFSCCLALEYIDLPENLTTMGGYAFSSCVSLRSIELPQGITQIENCTFNECSALETVLVPEGVTKIGEKAFYRCYNLKNITLPDALTEIGARAFMDCTSLTSIDVPEGVTIIGDYAFGSCKALKSAKLPSSVETIGYDIFVYCDLLDFVTAPAGSYAESWAVENGYK